MSNAHDATYLYDSHIGYAVLWMPLGGYSGLNIDLWNATDTYQVLDTQSHGEGLELGLGWNSGTGAD